MCQNYGVLDGKCRLPERAGGLGIKKMYSVNSDLAWPMGLEKKVCCRLPSFSSGVERCQGDLIILIRPGVFSNELVGIAFCL